MFSACLAMQPDLILIDPRQLCCDLAAFIVCLRDIQPQAVIALLAPVPKPVLTACANDACRQTSYEPRELLSFCRSVVASESPVYKP